MVLTLECPRRRRKGRSDDESRLELNLARMSEITTHTSMREGGNNLKKGQNCTMRMGRLYRGQTKKEITKVAISRTRERKKRRGGLNRGPEAQIAKKKEGVGSR